MKKLLKRLTKVFAGLTSHLQVKLVLLLLAGVAWFFVHTNQDMEIEFDLPLDLALELPEGRTLVSQPPDKVQVLLRGKGRGLLFFALFGQGVCRVDGGRGGESIPLTSKHLELDGAVDLSVAGILPAILPLDVDRLESRRLPVRLRGNLTAAEGWVLTGRLAPMPGHVKVTGPRSVLDTLSLVETETVELLNRKKDSEETVALLSPWPSLEIEPPTVQIAIRVDRRAERRFTGIPLQVRNLPAPLGVRPGTLSLTIVGGETDLASLGKDQIEAILDGEKLVPNQTQAPCRIIVPEGFNWTNPTPPLFRIVGKRRSPPKPDATGGGAAPEATQEAP